MLKMCIYKDIRIVIVGKELDSSQEEHDAHDPFAVFTALITSGLRDWDKGPFSLGRPGTKYFLISIANSIELL